MGIFPLSGLDRWKRPNLHSRQRPPECGMLRRNTLDALFRAKSELIKNKARVNEDAQGDIVALQVGLWGCLERFTPPCHLVCYLLFFCRFPTWVLAIVCGRRTTVATKVFG